MPPKKKAGHRRLSKAEKGPGRGQHPGQLYVFHGEETYLRDYYLGRDEGAAALAGAWRTSTSTPSRRKEMSPHAPGAGGGLPAHDERSGPWSLVSDFDLFKAGRRTGRPMPSSLHELPDYVCLVFVYDLIDYKADARTKLAAAIKENGTRGQLRPPGPGGPGGLGAPPLPGAGQGHRLPSGPGPDLPVRRPDDQPDRGDREDRGLRQGPSGSPGRTSTRWPPPSWTRWCSA